MCGWSTCNLQPSHFLRSNDRESESAYAHTRTYSNAQLERTAWYVGKCGTALCVCWFSDIELHRRGESGDQARMTYEIRSSRSSTVYAPPPQRASPPRLLLLRHRPARPPRGSPTQYTIQCSAPPPAKGSGWRPQSRAPPAPRGPTSMRKPPPRRERARRRRPPSRAARRPAAPRGTTTTPTSPIPPPRPHLAAWSAPHT